MNTIVVALAHPSERIEQMVSRCARALGPDVEYLIADEITSMLDALPQARIWRSLIQYSRQKRIGILLISYESALLKRLRPRTI